MKGDTGSRGALVSWALVACKASREILARLVRWVFKAFLVFQDPSAPWASKVLSVPRVSLALLVFVASKVRLVLLACVVLQAPLVPLVPLVFVARLALLAS